MFLYDMYLSETKMIIPIRCFTCGKVIGNKWEAYLGITNKENNLSKLKKHEISKMTILNFKYVIKSI